MLILRQATYNDLKLLQHWDEQPHVIASDPNDDWDWEYELKREPEWREQLIAIVDNIPIGFIQIIDPAKEETHYWGEIEDGKRAIDIWIGEASYLGKGFGTEMMKLALNRCFQDATVKAVVIDPLSTNTKAINFYKRIGFQFVEQRNFDEDCCEVYSIDRAAWKEIRDSH